MNRPCTVAWMSLVGISTWICLPAYSADEKKPAAEKPATEEKKAGVSSLEGKPAPYIEQGAWDLKEVIPGAETGDHFILPNLREHIVILAFYPGPKADPKTATECLGFKDIVKQLKASNAVVIGISGSTLNEQMWFHRNKANKLNFTLLGDETKEACKAYGVLDKNGKVNRTTFVIDKKGTIRKVFDVTDVKKHPQDVLDYVKNLKS